jgi:hypothetical protein
LKTIYINAEVSRRWIDTIAGIFQIATREVITANSSIGSSSIQDKGFYLRRRLPHGLPTYEEQPISIVPSEIEVVGSDEIGGSDDVHQFRGQILQNPID